MSDDKTHEATHVLGDEYRRAVEATANRKSEFADRGHPERAAQEFTVDGLRFTWWAIGNGPVFVTVNHATLGRVSRITTGDPESFAASLARALLQGSSNRVDPADGPSA